MHPVTQETLPSSANPAGEDRRRLAIRFRMLAWVWLSWCTDATMLALLSVWAGVPQAGTAFAIVLAGGTLSCGAFALAYARNLHLRWRDRFLTLPQLLVASAVILAAAAQAPAVAVPLLSMLYIVVAFAALRLTPMQLLVSWAGITVALAAVVSGSGAPLALPGATPLQAALSTIWTSLLVGRCALIGLYGATLRQKLLLRGRELADATGRLHELAMRDALTGALNRRATMDLLDEALRAQSAGGPAVSVALVDLDHFKGINDRFGHPVGDEVLRRFVTAAVRATREADRVGRWGGEEFLVVLPACADARAAAAIAERVRESVATHPWGEIAPGLSVTASIGVAAARPGAGTAELLARADRALYRAKHDGRDRVHVDG